MTRVAITGFGVVSPIGAGREAFWAALVKGKSGIAPITRFDSSTLEVQLAGEVKDQLGLPAEISAQACCDLKGAFLYAACREALSQAGFDRLGDDCLLHLGASLEVFPWEAAFDG
jgi:3-oxoacyl-[acyl-carrier-protein] synthase II